LPDRPAFGGGATATVIHPVVLAAMLVTAVLILVLPRRRVIAPFLIFVMLSPYGQQLYVAGVHWFAVRIVVLVGCIRLFRERGNILPHGLNEIDKAFVAWAFCRVLARLLLFHTVGMVPEQMNFWLGAFGGYFFLRYLIRDVEDIAECAKALAVVAVLAGICMANERLRDVNVFGYSGSIAIQPTVRDGLIRAQGCFGHPILAGCFGATVTPLFYWLWRSGRGKLLAAIGVLGGFMIVYFSASSTPVMAWAGGIGALLLWPIRRNMRVVRWGIVATLLGLAMVMKAPVWFIIARVNVVDGSGGWDRAFLIDTFIRHFSGWWLIGTSQMGAWGGDMWDLSNQFVAEGETGGLLTFILFILLISRSFSRIGRMRRRVDGLGSREWLYWILGAVMFAHILAYFGVSYWDQNQTWWFAFLAMVSAATTGLDRPTPSKVRISRKKQQLEPATV